MSALTVDPGHVIYGSDWPFAPLPAAQYFTDALDTFDGLDGATRSAINHTNALPLLPRIAGQA